MLRVKTITYSDAQNWGAALQTFALCHYFSSLSSDIECKVIDYKAFDSRIFKPRKVLKDVLYSAILYKQNKDRIKRYQMFRNNYISFCKLKSWEVLNEETDLFVTGSDQVWNCSNGVVPEFYLETVSSKKYKMAYAPSFGIKKLPDEHRERIKKDLTTFDFLSVREISGQAIINDLIGTNVNVVVDPVFLIDELEWDKIAHTPKEKNYLFVYVTEVSQEVVQIVKKYIKENPGTKIITPYAIPSVSAIVKKNIGPAEFLGYVKNATSVVSTSFHATAFSLIFGTPFCVVPHSTTGARVVDLLAKVNMEKFAFNTDTFKLHVLNERGEYKEALEVWVEESKAYIRKSLEDIQRRKLSKEGEKR